MSASQSRFVPCCCVFRWSGRITALILLAAWVLYVLSEGVPPQASISHVVWAQLAAMLALFAGYVLAWRREVLGTAVASAAFVMFYAVHLWGVSGFPQLAFALFGVPIVLFYLAHHYDTHGAAPVADTESAVGDPHPAP